MFNGLFSRITWQKTYCGRAVVEKKFVFCFVRMKNSGNFAICNNWGCCPERVRDG